MESSELKTQIDDQISNITAEGGLSPATEGANMKAIVDYVDQETILLSEDIAANATPVQMTKPINRVTAETNGLYVILPDITTFRIGRSVIVSGVVGYSRFTITAFGSNTFTLDGSLTATEVLVYNQKGYRFTKQSANNWLFEKIVDSVEMQVFTDGVTLTGVGRNDNRIALRAFGALYRLYATGTANPTANTFAYLGYGFPTGVTKSHVRTGVGLYEVRIIGDATLEAMDCTGAVGGKIFLEIRNSPTLVFVGSSYSDSAGVRTITYQYQNLVSGVLTDAFNHGEIVDIKFFGPNIS